ncbi:T-cell surface glycoprotein CD8 alpha chain isoform X2 [Antennarius striatus]|uniref:T-cell surface glycoprotein CD8 alpha chain isoform X2 n=1 Tax=Antennarius striatus TaxID=241820 RepID=UPI0035B461A7
MDQRWIHILVILVFYQKATSSGDVIVKDGTAVEIRCQPPEMGSMIVWFRVLDKRGMEFIASFSNSGLKKSSNTPTSMFSYAKVKQHVLILDRFNKGHDSGSYGCASLFKGTYLKFGEVTRLVGVERKKEEERDREVQLTTVAIATAVTEHRRTTSTMCVCGSEEPNPSIFCTPLVLGPLAAGCGLLLILLIIVLVYCNKIRTRRCPHHYRRKPQMMTGQKK